MRLLLLGCSGFVGRGLVPFLLELGHSITLVSRQAHPFPAQARDRLTCLQLDPADPVAWPQGGLEGPLGEALGQADGVVNLAGEPIADKRWTPAHRELLLQSRLRTTAHLVAAMAAMAKPPAVLINGSAVGFYGSSADLRFTEASTAGSDFLAEICSHWEAAAGQLPPACRLVTLRIGIVVGPDGGALGKMLPVFRMGFGGPVGSGRQWMSWIHRHDLCRLIAAALEDPAYSGTYNAVGPTPTTMAGFAAALGRALGRPSLLPVPGPLLQLLLGDGAQVVLEGQQVIPERLLAQGFKFDYGELNAALVAATSPAGR